MELITGDVEAFHCGFADLFDPIILPLKGDTLLIECDEAAVGDGDAVGCSAQDNAALPHRPGMVVCSTRLQVC